MESNWLLHYKPSHRVCTAPIEIPCYFTSHLSHYTSLHSTPIYFGKTEHARVSITPYIKPLVSIRMASTASLDDGEGDKGQAGPPASRTRSQTAEGRHNIMSKYITKLDFWIKKFKFLLARFARSQPKEKICPGRHVWPSQNFRLITPLVLYVAPRRF